MDWGTAILLTVFGAFAVSALLRLRRAGASTFDDDFTLADRRLVGSLAFYVLTPACVLASQLAQIATLSSLDGRLGRFETYLFWGIVEPAQPEAFTPLTRCAVAATGPLTLVGLGVLAWLWLAHRPRGAAPNFLLLELGRILFLLAFAVHPLASLLSGEGDFAVARAALNERYPESGEVALLGYGILSAYAFFRWRRARSLRALTTPLHDAARRARQRLVAQPEDASALRALGTAQLAAGDDAGLETLAMAQRRAPGDPRNGLALGHAYLRRRQPRLASAHLRAAGEALDDAPTRRPGEDRLRLEILLGLANARLSLGDTEGALLTAREAEEQSPGETRALILQADALTLGGRREEARDALERALPIARGGVAREIRRRLAALERH